MRQKFQIYGILHGGSEVNPLTSQTFGLASILNTGTSLPAPFYVTEV